MDIARYATASCVKPSLGEVELDRSGDSRSVVATVPEDAGRAGAARRGNTGMGHAVASVTAEMRTNGTDRFRSDGASGKLESGGGRAGCAARDRSARRYQTRRSRIIFRGFRRARFVT